MPRSPVKAIKNERQLVALLASHGVSLHAIGEALGLPANHRSRVWNRMKKIAELPAPEATQKRKPKAPVGYRVSFHAGYTRSGQAITGTAIVGRKANQYRLLEWDSLIAGEPAIGATAYSTSKTRSPADAERWLTASLGVHSTSAEEAELRLGVIRAHSNRWIR